MQQVVFLLLIGLVLIQADSLLEMDAHCAEECGSPEYDELVKELDHQDEVLNDLVTRAVNVEHSLDQSKKEHDDADRESRNLLLRLDRLHSDKEHDVCPKKHRKCLTSAARDGKPCVANILVCDGEEDCLDGSDEDPELCTFPLLQSSRWMVHYIYNNCSLNTEVRQGFLKLTEIHTIQHFPSLLKVQARQYYKPTETKDAVDSYILNGIYNYATRTMVFELNFGGSLFIKRYTYNPGLGIWNVQVHRIYDEHTACLKSVLTPITRM